MLRNSCSSGESSDEDGYIDDPAEEEHQTFTCLFCEQIFKSSSELFGHTSTVHLVNMLEIFSKLSFYDIVKIINYTRALKISVDEFKDIPNIASNLSDDYLKPCMDDDALLMIDFEEILQNESPLSSNTICENGVQKDLSRISLLESKLEHMQKAYIELLEKSDEPNSAIDSVNKSYFDSYADYSIHSEMLKDKVRTEAYRDYIYQNKELFSGMAVLDVGCGTGILSMFCAKAGAISVTAVDNSRIIEKSKQIIRKNDLSSVIEIVEGQIEDLEFDKKFDVIVSEWMGYALLFECMLDSVITAREKHLKPGGLMVPNRASLFLSAVSDPVAYKNKFTFWENIYDFDMSDVIPELFKGAFVETVEAKHVISSVCGFKHLDLSTVQVPDLEFSSQFKLEVNKSCPLTAFTVYFSCFFDGDYPIVLKTSPDSKSTHWVQTVLYLEKVIKVSEGDVVQGTVSFNKISAERRGYVIKLKGSCEAGSFNQEFYIR